MRQSITLFGIFCLAFISTLSAQSPSKVVWGEAVEAGKSRTIKAFVSYDEDAYYFVRKTIQTNDLGFLVRLDSKMNFENEKPLKRPIDNSRGHSLRDVSILDGQPSLIWHSYADKTAKYVSQDFDGSTLTLQNGLTTMTETFTEYIGIMKKYVDYGQVMTSVSKDLSKRVFTYSGTGFSAENAAFGICVTGIKNEMLYNADYNAGKSTSEVNRLAVAVGNDGTSYALVRIASGKKSSPGSELKIWKFNPDGSNEGEISISFPDKNISKMSMQVGLDGSIICAGVYSYKDLLSAQGTAYIKIDGSDFSITDKKLEDFDTALIEQSSGSKKLNGYKMVKLQGPIILDNGNAVMGIEQYEGSFEPLVYRDILVFEFGENGGISKTGIVRKEQNGSNAYFNFLSYKLVTKGDKAYVVYNDVAKNTETPGNEKHSKCIITGYNPAIIAELTSSGFVKEVACHSKKEKMRVSIAEIQQTQEGNLIFMQNQISGDNSKMQFGKLEL